MDLAAALLEVGTGRAEASFALFAQTLDPQWIAQALQGKSLFVTLVLTSAQREADGWKIDARWGISWWADKDKVGGLFKVNPTLEETGLPTLTFDSPTPGLGPITLTVHGKTFMTGKTVGLALHPSAGGKGTIEIRLQRIEPGPAPDNMIKGVDGADMVLVPAGEFWMGSTQDEIQELIAFCRERNSPPCATDYNTRELPRHRVLLDAFYIDRFEVTNALFEQFVRATRHSGSCSGGPGMRAVSILGAVTSGTAHSLKVRIGDSSPGGGNGGGR
jgi:formylglycine-generating enzyme required for sulfatase activity